MRRKKIPEMEEGKKRLGGGVQREPWRATKQRGKEWLERRHSGSERSGDDEASRTGVSGRN